jgi:Family of unknown function (DUF6338)
MGVRARAASGSQPKFQDQLIWYALASAGYYAAATPLFNVPAGVKLDGWLIDLLEYFGAPILIGVAWAYATDYGIGYRIASACGLHLAHHIPTAWDYAFNRITTDSFLLVTLADGSQVAGRMAEPNFASSDGAERDLLIGEVWTFDKDEQWSLLRPKRSILLKASDIRYIEFFSGDDHGG